MTQLFALDEATTDLLIEGGGLLEDGAPGIGPGTVAHQREIVALLEHLREQGDGPAPAASAELRSLFSVVDAPNVTPLASRRTRARRALRVAGGMGIAAKIALGAGAAAAAIGGASATGILPAPVQHVLSDAVGAVTPSHIDNGPDHDPRTPDAEGDRSSEAGTSDPSSEAPVATSDDAASTSSVPGSPTSDPPTIGKPAGTPGTPPDHAGPPEDPGKPAEPGKPADTPGNGTAEAPGQTKPTAGPATPDAGPNGTAIGQADASADTTPNGDANGQGDGNPDPSANAKAIGQADTNVGSP